MARQFACLDQGHRDFIALQRIFFTGSCAADTRVNISPRPTDHFHVLGPNTVAYLDLTGSGSETSAHIAADGRLTIMFCAFAGPPLILRLYGQGRVAYRGAEDYDAFLAAHYQGVEPAGARQVVFLEADLVQTSCGFGVPLFTHESDRQGLVRWAETKGADGLRAYRAQKNAHSMDGLPTGHPDTVSQGEADGP